MCLTNVTQSWKIWKNCIIIKKLKKIDLYGILLSFNNCFINDYSRFYD